MAVIIDAIIFEPGLKAFSVTATLNLAILDRLLAVFDCNGHFESGRFCTS